MEEMGDSCDRLCLQKEDVGGVGRSDGRGSLLMI